jgi:SAM-dependent methyltransferase
MGVVDAQRQRLDRLCKKFRCPECRAGGLVRESDEALRCVECGQVFPVEGGVPFLFEAARIPAFLQADRERPKRRSPPRYARQGEYHSREYRIERLLPRPGLAREVLLLGCGDASERGALIRLGYLPVAFDIKRSDGTDFLADAHRVPLQDASFDVVLSMQVLEHLHSPWIAVAEVARVLRPGGWFVGSVAFLKPYHRSYFHMTHRGVAWLLKGAGLTVDVLVSAQSLTYALYGSLLPLGPRPLRRRAGALTDRLIASLRARVWALRAARSPDEPATDETEPVPLSFRDFDRLRFSPVVVFRARKPAGESG